MSKWTGLQHPEITQAELKNFPAKLNALLQTSELLLSTHFAYLLHVLKYSNATPDIPLLLPRMQCTKRLCRWCRFCSTVSLATKNHPSTICVPKSVKCSYNLWSAAMIWQRCCLTAERSEYMVVLINPCCSSILKAFLIWALIADIRLSSAPFCRKKSIV